MRLTLKALSLLAALTATLSTTNAATLVWGAGFDNGFSLENGSNLAANNLVRLGTFDIAPEIIAANAGNIAFLNAHFIEVASARIGEGANGAPEHFGSTDNVTINSPGVNFAGAQAYIWVFSATDNSSVENSINTAQQHGIFAFDKLVNPDWAFPLDDVTPNDFSIDISDLTNEAGTALITPGAQVIVGSFNTGTSDEFDAPNFGLKVIPEPGSALLATVGGVAMLLRRRRRA